MKITRSLLGRAPAALLAAGLVAAPLSALAHDDHGSRHSRPRLVGYFTSWAVYSAKNYTAKSVKDSGAASRLTHIQYAFANITPDLKCGVSDPWADYQRPYPAADDVDGVDETWSETEVRGHFNQLRKLKKLYPKLKVLISVGGWTFSNRFSDAALTPASRQAFVSSCVDMFIKGNVGEGRTSGDLFDGIDVDWEFPGACGNTCDFRPEDTQNFTLLMAEFRKQLDAAGRTARKKYELAIAAPVVESLYSKMELKRVARSLDFISIMGYDMHGSWELQTNFHAPLLPSSADPAGKKLNVHTTVDAFLRAGVPRDKVVVGVPFYGRGWQGVPNVNHGLYQSATGPAPGPVEVGSMDYRDLAPIAAVQGSFRDLRTQGHWIYNPATGMFWGYDDAFAMKVKGTYVKVRGLGGNMFWELSQDSTSGTLVRALHAGQN